MNNNRKFNFCRRARRGLVIGACPKAAPGRNRGFTLIEVMIAVVIVGILAAIAYPSYRNYVRDSRRSEAKAALTDVANRLERYVYQCNAYTNNFAGSQSACTGLGLATGATVTTLPTEHSYYSLAITLGTGYTIAATAIGDQAALDTLCTSLSFDSLGQKTATGSETSRCWK